MLKSFFNVLNKRQKNFYTSDTLGQKTIMRFFQEAGRILNLSDSQIETIQKPHSILKLNVPVKRDDGTFSTIVAYRCHHTLHELPLRGGIVVNPKINQNMIADQALMTTIQHAFLKIPFGGARGGLKMNMKNFSDSELERIFKRFTIELAKYNFIGSNKDVASQEQGTTNIQMDQMKDIFEQIYGFNDINALASTTGKSDTKGGMKNHNLATGSAIYYIIKNLIKNKVFNHIKEQQKLPNYMKDQEVIVIGFGYMGKNAAEFLWQNDVKVVGIQEIDGCVFNRNGINIPEFADHYEKYNCMMDYKDYLCDEETLFDRDCDFLVLATDQCMITNENSELINAKIVIEAANQAISFAAEKSLENRGIVVVPDLLGNSGKIISSYLEWLKNIQHKSMGRLRVRWEQNSKIVLLKAIQQKLNEKGIEADFSKIDEFYLRGGSGSDIVRSTVSGIIEEAMMEVLVTKQKHNCSIRTAALINGIETINEKLKDAGKY